MERPSSSVPSSRSPEVSYLRLGEEMHAARLSGKRLLTLWNALPGVEKQTKVGDRDTLIDRLWAAIEALPDPDPQSDTKRPSKQDAVIAMLQRPEGATIDEAARANGLVA